MLAREADAMFWIGRYVERAEATARMVDVQYHSELEGRVSAGQTAGAGGDPSALWGPILAISGDADLFVTLYNDTQVERNVLDFFCVPPGKTATLSRPASSALARTGEASAR